MDFYCAVTLRVVLTTWLCSMSVAVYADSSTSTEQARLSAELAQASAQARQRIESGSDNPAELASDYLTLAIASATQGDSTASEAAFKRLLAIDPSFRLKGSFPDEVRSPYLEARGFWASYEVALHVSAVVDEQQGTLVLKVTDPAKLSARLRLRARTSTLQEMQEVVRSSQADLSVPLTELGGGSEIEYSLTLLDELGNRIWQLGDDAQPQRIVRAEPAKTTSPAFKSAVIAQPPPALPAAATALEARKQPSGPRRFALAASLSLATGVLSLGGAGYAHFRREQLAKDWNAVRCEGSGATRAAVCGDERERLGSMQNLAIGLYAAGGASLLTGVLLLVLNPMRGDDTSTHTLRCTGGASEWSVGCSLTF